VDPVVLHCCEACKEMKLSKRISKRASHNVSLLEYILHSGILTVFEDFLMYDVSWYNRELKYQYNTNIFLNMIYFHSTTPATPINFEGALKVCL